MSAAYSPVPELNLLKDFQDRYGYESYSQSFGLDDWNDTSGLEAGWSKDPGFLAGLLPFARATGGGSFYALWRIDDRADLATLPVIAFGDEGGEHVVARDLRELFRLLTFDSEPSIGHEDLFFYRADDEDHSAHHDTFVTWLAGTFGLTPVDDPDEVVAAARDEFGERFTAWKSRYLDW
ncbi:hypothetical protein AMIS_60540 [Actinoplanes missouriensis 431]|uniref:Knr4/Smi1-like domain-containing protein n=1 Tax=Actinoplanes missouriensis (strain ATCC 14538 / DSM 43046 / CBS 188.64 / JCM 3121 / NBRC 102363 / NCIMB 12654 / NRRL B-3342 / UNCC 431) TaxID=512565 RepID=I0HE37_ACTM4|nr:hypothetical protein [Actinoplanes missouriensis]BAL91274.1 hypothetical protein AMIS_60540 [Actinoplanes missouriensis 431]